MEAIIDLSRLEKLVVFDFDDTIYTHTQFHKPNSCNISIVPVFELSDRSFLEKALKELISNGIHVGVASFGKKGIIIDTMNYLLYGPSKKPSNPDEKPYFSIHNVVTVPDVQEYWKKALATISNTFKQYVSASDGDVDAAFTKFLKEKKPQNEAKYFCLKLEPEAKIQMIQILCEHYNVTDKSYVRYFDDDKTNIQAALARGIMGHLVPPIHGLTGTWWRQQCSLINACNAYENALNIGEPTHKKSKTDTAS